MSKCKGLATKCIGKLKAACKGLVSVATGLALSAAACVPSFATDGTSTGIQISFDPSQMFTYSNVIISCLMPVVYITAGLSLGFTVIYALKSAFSSRM